MSLTEVTLESDERRWKDFIALRVQLEQDMDGLDPWIATGLRFVRIHQVPFPRIENMNIKDPMLNQTLLRTLLRRWHPDKFMQQFGSQLRPCEREQILSSVNQTVSMLNKLLNDSRGICSQVTIS